MGTLRIALPGRSAADARALAALVEAGAAAAPSAPAADGGRVVLVRRARVDLAVSATAPETVAVQAGRALDGALRGALRRPQSADDVLVFASTAEYVAHFVEELAGGRAVDVWYFRPLLACRGRGLGDTLANLARAEPDAWPQVLAILRRRGLLGTLLARLTGGDRDVLRGVPAPSARPLEAAEAGPLFAAARDAAAAASASAPVDGSAAPPSGDDRPPRLRIDPEEALRAYLQTHPPAPESWGDPASLGACVAEMLRWLLDGGTGPIDTGAAEAALARHPWIDPAPARRALREHAAAGEAARARRASAPSAGATDRGGDAPSPPRHRGTGADDASHPPEAEDSAARGTDAPRGPSTADVEEDGFAIPRRPRGSGGSINRTQALRYLHAARLLASPGAPAPIAAAVSADDPLLEYEDEVWAVDAAAASLAQDGAAPTPERVLQRLEAEARAASSASPPPRGRPLATLAAAARQLEDADRRALAGALSKLARARPSLLGTEAAGLFFLIRPLVDLGVPGLASRAGVTPPALRALLHAAALRAAAAPDGDPAAELFAWGWMRGEWEHPSAAVDADARHAELAAALRVQAARHGLALAEADGAEDLPGLLVEAACRQLVRWLRGFESSSPAYALGQFVRRAGAVHVPAAGAVEVRWPASGFDVVLERAGYLDPLGSVPWWDRRGVRWAR